jgi:hypothetical protein
MLVRQHNESMLIRIFRTAWIGLTLTLVMVVLELSCGHSDGVLRIKAGQTITRGLAATDGRGVLSFEGESGQVLMVNRAENENFLDDKADKLVLVPPGASESEAIPMIQDDGLGCWVGPLSKTGAYQLILRRSSDKLYRLRITLMAPNDPRVDPGISPGQVSMDTTLWGTGFSLSRQPFDPPHFDGVEDNWPAHLALVTKNLQFRIMSVEGIKNTPWEDDRWLKGLARLESALKPGGKIPAPDVLPLAVYQDAGLCFWGKQELVEGKGWRGLRWIGWYAQDCSGGPVTDPEPMNYILEAVSRNGRHYVMVFADIAYLHPTSDWQRILDEEDEKTVRLVNPKPVGRERSQAMDSIDEEEDRLLHHTVNLRLDQAEPISFKPDLRQLDAAVRSLELR